MLSALGTLWACTDDGTAGQPGDIGGTDVDDVDVADTAVDCDGSPCRAGCDGDLCDDADALGDTSDATPCEALCERDVACGGEGGPRDACIDDCEAQLEQARIDDGDGCADALGDAYLCGGSLSCPDYEDFVGGQEDGPCAEQIDGVFDACAGLDGTCIAACTLIDEGLATCDDRDSRMVRGRGGRVTRLRRATSSLAVRMDVLEPQTVLGLRERFGERVSVHPERGVVVIDGMPPWIARWRLRPYRGGIAEELATWSTVSGRRIVEDHALVVRVRRADALRSVLGNVPVESVEPLAFGADIVRVVVEPGVDVIALAETIAAHPDVDYAQPDFLRSYAPRDVPNDPGYAAQWHLHGEGAVPGVHVSAETAWSITRGSSDVVLAINDDGIDLRHPDLTLVEGVNEPPMIDGLLEMGCCAHGTAVAGIASATGFNDEAVVGVCPSCSVMPVFTRLELEADSAIAETITIPVDRGAAVINNSWGPADGDPTVADPDPPEREPLAEVVEDALAYAEDEGRGGLGTIVVFAAGNGNESTEGDPFVSHPTTLVVGAIDDRGRKAAYSDFGPAIDVVAPSDGGIYDGLTTTDVLGEGGFNPGGSVQADASGDTVDSFGGTSAAAPIVTGVAGLILSVAPELDASEVRELIRSSAVPIDPRNGDYVDGHSPYFGYGRVDAYRAVRAAESTCTPLDEERCNGLDDTCDDAIDEGCVLAGFCQACAVGEQCSAGACSSTPGDAGYRCLAPAEDGCPDDAIVEGDLCVPASGRCDDCITETCNGVDDDCDELIDEDGVCPRVFRGACAFDAQCGDDAVCAGGRCTPICEDDIGCAEGGACLPGLDRYGREAGVHICAYPFALDCVAALCEEQGLTTDQVTEIETCVFDAQSSGDLCGATLACLPAGF